MTEGDRADGLPRAPFVVYNTLLWGLAPLGPAIVLGAKVLSRRLGKTWRGQLGLELPPAPACEDSIWIQAASVGETQAAGPVIAALRRRLPGSPIVLTSSTPEGQRLARERSGADRFGTFPFDFGPVVARYFETFRPKLCVVVETEIWPNLVRACARRGVPLALVNG
ncbi:MAG: hypothetical protein HY303_17805, partial [Candidatus Wallbacteria bacterium]|nr:hypothetical protein [Candidatus Wallbacteria bacterium]